MEKIKEVLAFLFRKLVYSWKYQGYFLINLNKSGGDLFMKKTFILSFILFLGIIIAAAHFFRHDPLDEN